MLQIENLLLSARGQIKLCDFGSATAQSHYPDHTWSAMKRSLVEDEVKVCNAIIVYDDFVVKTIKDCAVTFACVLQMARNTTPMYRTPEMLDTYLNYPINEQSDIWV